jgi:hypothetical protein
MWLEVKLHVLLRREGDPDATVSFMLEWLARATHAARAAPTPEALEEHVFSIASLIASLNRDGTDGLRLARLHEWLELFSGGVVDVDMATRIVRERTPSTVRYIAEKSGADLPATIVAVLERKTLRQELVEVLELHRQGLAIPPDSAVFSSEAGSALQAALRRPASTARIREQQEDRPICPACFATLSNSAAQALRRDRVAKCSMNCGCTIVRTRP